MYMCNLRIPRLKEEKECHIRWWLHGRVLLELLEEQQCPYTQSGCFAFSSSTVHYRQVNNFSTLFSLSFILNHKRVEISKLLLEV